MLRSGSKEEELGETGGAVAADHDTHRVVLRRVFAKTVGSQRGEDAVESSVRKAKCESAPSTLPVRKEPVG